MRRKVVPTILFAIFITTVILVSLSLNICREAISSDDDFRPSPVNLTAPTKIKPAHSDPNLVIQEEGINLRPIQHVSSKSVNHVAAADADDDGLNETVSILLPAWEVLVIVSSPESSLLLSDSWNNSNYTCVFQNNATSPARFSGILPFTNRTTFKCILPNTVRRSLPFSMPVLVKSPEILPANNSPLPELMRWSFLVYDSFSTEDDVVVFAKGVNNRQGVNRPPKTLRCVFGDDVNTAVVKTAVTSSSQEVFRCPHPAETPPSGDHRRIKVSLEIADENNRLVPSVAYYYAPKRTLALQEAKSQLCASTMVYNVAKFLKEWVVYHSKIGVEKFILYDNDSDDDLNRVVEELVKDGYDVKTLLWLWPKTQEAGFSHSALYAKESCTWMMYTDVDEFVFSPSWLNSSNPSTRMLTSMLPKSTTTNPIQLSSLSSSKPRLKNRVGQVSIYCNEYGPSNQTSNPINGVIQGYTCRRKVEQRHKSIVLMEAIHPSLLNAIHHFELKGGYKWRRLNLADAVVNHYKYQAWSEFKAKFRRRVSAYVADWTQAVNPLSKDRTPGLGFAPIEPKGWSEMFCEVRDHRLKELTHKWFGSFSQSSGIRLAWQ